MEVPGRHIQRGSNDQSRILLCDPCKAVNEDQPAVSYCTVCNEYLCEADTRAHRKAKALKGHVLIERNAMPNQKLKTLEDDTCSTHSGKHIEYYCEDHRKWCCTLCATVEHRECDIAYIDTIAEGYELGEEYTSLVKAIVDQTKRLKNTKKEAAKMERYVQLNLENLISAVKKFRVELNAALDFLESATLKELQLLLDSDIRLSDSVSTQCDTLLSDEQDFFWDVESLKKNNQSRQLVIQSKKALTQIAECERKLAELSQQNTIKGYTFSPNDEILQSLKSLSRLGHFPGMKYKHSPKGIDEEVKDELTAVGAKNDKNPIGDDLDQENKGTMNAEKVIETKNETVADLALKLNTLGHFPGIKYKYPPKGIDEEVKGELTAFGGKNDKCLTGADLGQENNVTMNAEKGIETKKGIDADFALKPNTLGHFPGMKYRNPPKDIDEEVKGELTAVGGKNDKCLTGADLCQENKGTMNAEKGIETKKENDADIAQKLNTLGPGMKYRNPPKGIDEEVKGELTAVGGKNDKCLTRADLDQENKGTMNAEKELRPKKGIDADFALKLNTLGHFPGMKFRNPPKGTDQEVKGELTAGGGKNDKCLTGADLDQENKGTMNAEKRIETKKGIDADFAQKLNTLGHFPGMKFRNPPKGTDQEVKEELTAGGGKNDKCLTGADLGQENKGTMNAEKRIDAKKEIDADFALKLNTLDRCFPGKEHKHPPKGKDQEVKGELTAVVAKNDKNPAGDDMDQENKGTMNAEKGIETKKEIDADFALKLNTLGRFPGMKYRNPPKGTDQEVKGELTAVGGKNDKCLTGADLDQENKGTMNAEKGIETKKEIDADFALKLNTLGHFPGMKYEYPPKGTDQEVKGELTAGGGKNDKCLTGTDLDQENKGTMNAEKGIETKNEIVADFGLKPNATMDDARNEKTRGDFVRDLEMKLKMRTNKFLGAKEQVGAEKCLDPKVIKVILPALIIRRANNYYWRFRLLRNLEVWVRI